MRILLDLSYKDLNSLDTGILFKKWKKLHKQVSYECLSVFWLAEVESSELGVWENIKKWVWGCMCLG